MSGLPLRIAFVVPAFWPAEAFGGPVWVLRSLARELVRRGHTVDVWTTNLQRVDSRARIETRSASVDGATVHYLSTPVRYRWMGFTPMLRHHLSRATRADVAHVFGFRDPIGLDAAGWFRAHGVPYVFEALGMFAPKLRKRRLKRLLDATLLASLPRKAAAVVAASEIERREYLNAGLPAEHIVVRPNGIPEVPHVRSRRLRREIGLTDEPLVLYVGRVAEGKGLDLLVQTLPALPEAHLVLVGPDDGHGTTGRLVASAGRLGVAERFHLVGQWPQQPLDLYADADVFALPSAHENFGMAAAEAASAGVPVIVSDRCGVTELLHDHGALVIGYDARELEDALTCLFSDPALRARLGEAGRARAAEYSWPVIAALQETIYRDVLAT